MLFWSHFEFKKSKQDNWDLISIILKKLMRHYFNYSKEAINIIINRFYGMSSPFFVNKCAIEPKIQVYKWKDLLTCFPLKMIKTVFFGWSITSCLWLTSTQYFYSVCSYTRNQSVGSPTFWIVICNVNCIICSSFWSCKLTHMEENHGHEVFWTKQYITIKQL